MLPEELLPRQQAKWESQAISSYRFRFEERTDDSHDNVVITVEEGQVVSVVDALKGESEDDDSLQWTIDDVFYWTDIFLLRADTETVVTYNQQYGFPESVEHRGAPQGDVSWSVTEFEPQSGR